MDMFLPQIIHTNKAQAAAQYGCRTRIRFKLTSMCAKSNISLIIRTLTMEPAHDGTTFETKAKPLSIERTVIIHHNRFEGTYRAVHTRAVTFGSSMIDTAIKPMSSCRRMWQCMTMPM